MPEFENVVIGKSAIPSLIITAILMLVIPAIFFIYWRKSINSRQKSAISLPVLSVLSYLPAFWSWGCIIIAYLRIILFLDS